MFPGQVLSHMQDAVDGLLPDTCTILSLATISDEQGGFVETWETAQAGVPCRVDPASGDEQMTGSQAVRPFYTYTITLPHGTPLTAEQRILHNGVTYNVTAVDADKSWAACVRAKCEIASTLRASQ